MLVRGAVLTQRRDGSTRERCPLGSQGKKNSTTTAQARQSTRVRASKLRLTAHLETTAIRADFSQILNAKHILKLDFQKQKFAKSRTGNRISNTDFTLEMYFQMQIL